MHVKRTRSFFPLIFKFFFSLSYTAASNRPLKRKPTFLFSLIFFLQSVSRLRPIMTNVVARGYPADQSRKQFCSNKGLGYHIARKERMLSFVLHFSIIVEVNNNFSKHGLKFLFVSFSLSLALANFLSFYNFMPTGYVCYRLAKLMNLISPNRQKKIYHKKSSIAFVERYEILFFFNKKTWDSTHLRSLSKNKAWRPTFLTSLN